jgi:hypothetical protein
MITEQAIEAHKATQTAAAEVHAKQGGLNWSMQHWLEVYSPGFQSPKSFAGAD